MKQQIKKFKVEGEIFIWSYKENVRNYPGWNFTVNNEASESLLHVLELMEKCEWSSKKTVKTKLPKAVHHKALSFQNSKWMSKPVLILSYRKLEAESYWKLLINRNSVEIQFGAQKLDELRGAIAGIPKGKGDFAISDEDENNILYFWWNLEE